MKFWFLILLFITINGFTQNDSIVGARIEFDTLKLSKTTLKNDVAMYLFYFKNTGDETLYISRALSSGGGQMVSFFSKEVEPGRPGYIAAKVQSNFAHELRRQIAIESNAKNGNRIALSTNTCIIDEQENYVKFDTLTIERKMERNADGRFYFWYTNIGFYPLSIRYVKTSSGSICPTYDKKEILPGERGCIEIKYDTSRIGNFHRSISVRTNQSSELIILRIKGTVRTSE